MKKVRQSKEQEAPQKVRNITKEVAAFAFEQAEKKLDKQMETFDKVTNRNTTVLRWLLIAICSLMGILASQTYGAEKNPIVLWLSIYGLSALIVIAIFLVVTGLFNKDMITSGSGPGVLLSSGRQEDMTQDGREDKLYALQEFHLETLQNSILFNRETLSKVIWAYRRTVIAIVVATVIGAIGLVLMLCLIS